MGTIFDPDFDMYSRNPNCFKLDNNKDNSIAPMIEADDHSTTLNIPDPTITTVLHPDPTNLYHTHHTVIPHPDSDTTLHAERPTYTTYTTLDHDIKEVPSAYPVGSTSPTYHVYHQSDWPSDNNDKVVYSHDPNPLYQYPMLYEPNYPAPNDQVYYPGGYAQNVPTLEDRYKPGPSSSPSTQNSQSNPSHKPILGSGYGNGYSYGTPISYSTTRRPSRRPSNGYDRPTTGYDRPSTGYDRPYDRPTAGYDGTSYYNREQDKNRPDRYRPDYNGQSSERPYGNRDRDYGNKDNSYGYRDYNNRPDPDYDNNRQGTSRPSASASADGGPTKEMYNPNRVGNSSSTGNKTITTFFNPEDYYNGEVVFRSDVFLDFMFLISAKPGSGVMGSGDQAIPITCEFFFFLFLLIMKVTLTLDL